jgi:ParB/RepB/Spo0J family partition protein
MKGTNMAKKMQRTVGGTYKSKAEKKEDSAGRMPATPGAAAEYRRVLIEAALKDLTPSPGNRAVREDSPSFGELLASVTAQGVLEPLHVRNDPDHAGQLQILAGHRRAAAAVLAGLKTVPAFAYGDLGEEAAAEVRYITNYGREDLTVLEEGQAVAMLLEAYHGEARAVAARMGQTEKWVRLRARIAGHLAACWQELAAEGGELAAWSAGHWGLLARLPEAMQEYLYKNIYSLRRATLTIAELESGLAEHLNLLSAAPFDTADATLVKGAGACGECPSRTSCQAVLWAELAEADAAADRCTNRLCWEKKTAASLKRRRAQLQAEHGGDVPLICLGEGRGPKGVGKVLNTYSYKKCKKSDPKAVVAMAVDGAKAGKVEYIRFRKGYTPREEKAKVDAAAGDTVKTLKQLRADLEDKRWAEVSQRLEKKISSCECPPVADFIRVAGPLLLWCGLDIMGNPELSVIANTHGDIKECCARLWEKLLEQAAEHFSRGNLSRKTTEAMGELLGIDVAAMYAEVRAEAAYTEPAEWANLKADGTPKKK